MELRQLKCFVTAGQLSSITKAAKKLHVSQPNVTTAIQKLESELGVELFERKQKRLYLTPSGKTFLERIDAALSQIQDAVSIVTETSQSQYGKIRIGIPPTIGAALFPEMLSRFTDLHPRIVLSVVEDGSWSIREKVESGELDLGILILSNLSPTLDTAFLAREQIMVCLPPDHPLARQTDVTFSDLKNEALILLGQHSYHHHLIIREFERLQIKPHVLLTSNQVETIKGLVAKNMGVSFLFESLVRQESGIVAKPFAPPCYVDLGLAWRKDLHMSAATRTFIDFFQ